MMNGSPRADSSDNDAVEGWVLSFAFATFDEAGPIYERVRDLVFKHDVDAGVFRIVLNGRTHVVALGLVPMPPDIAVEIEAILSAGEDALLPDQVLFALAIRHGQFSIPGMKFERRGEKSPTMTFE